MHLPGRTGQVLQDNNRRKWGQDRRLADPALDTDPDAYLESITEPKHNDEKPAFKHP